MNLILIRSDEVDKNNEVTLEGRRASHILGVLKGKIGKSVALGIVNGKIGQGEIIEIADSQVKLRLSLTHRPKRPKVTVILSMVRPQIMKRTLEHLTTLGVRHIYLIGSRRVEKSYFSQRLFDDDSYQKHLFLGLEQAKDTWLPQVSIHRQFKPFTEDILPQILESIPHRLIAHPDGYPEYDKPIGENEQIALTIGPEGGFIDYEVEKFTALGFLPLSFGPRILRVETAVPYLFGKLGL